MRVSANPRSRDFLRYIAKNIREQLKLENEPKFPIVQVIELLAADEEEEFQTFPLRILLSLALFLLIIIYQ